MEAVYQAATMAREVQSLASLAARRARQGDTAEARVLFTVAIESGSVDALTMYANFLHNHGEPGELTEAIEHRRRQVAPVLTRLRDGRAALVRVVASLGLAFAVGQPVAALSTEVRPFQTHPVHQLIPHAAGPSLPSDHATGRRSPAGRTAGGGVPTTTSLTVVAALLLAGLVPLRGIPIFPIAGILTGGAQTATR